MSTSCDAILQCRGVSRTFGGVAALTNVSLSVDATPHILAIIGPNGAGKTTLFNVISGRLQPTRGSVIFAGEEVTGKAPHVIRRVGIARTYQDVRVFGSLTAVENVATAASATLRETRRWTRALAAAAAALGDVGFRASLDAQVGDLNLFERKQVDVARALVTRPRLVMVDEFLAGIGDKEIEEACDVLRRVKERGAVVMIIEHVMRAVMGISDRVVVLDRGELIADGDPASVSRHDQVIEAYLGVGWTERQAHAR